jgi:hypothetical protein
VIGQRIEHKRRTILKPLRFPFTARAHFPETLVGPPAHRQHIVVADEHVDLANQQFTIGLSA